MSLKCINFKDSFHLVPKVTQYGCLRVRSDVLCYAKSLQLCLTLRDLMDCSPPGSSVHWILQARILLQGIFLTEGLNFASLKSPALAGKFFTTWEVPPRKLESQERGM